MRRLALLVVLIVLPGSAEARTFKGDGPLSLAVGHGAAWVGHGHGTVTRVDARSLRALSRRLGSDMGANSITSLAPGFGSVWAASNSTPLRRLDPRTGKVRAKVWRDRNGWRPTLTVVGAGFVWVADYERNAVFRVSPRTNRITGQKVLAHTLRGVAAGPQGVWVQTIPGRGPITGPNGTRIVSRLDPKTLRLHRAFRLTCDASLQPLGRSLWVLDNCDGRVRRFDAKDGILGPPIKTAPGAGGFASGFGSLWVSDGATLRRIDPARRTVVARIRLEGPFLEAGAGFVWVLDWGDGGWLRRIDPATNRALGRPIRLSARQ